MATVQQRFAEQLPIFYLVNPMSFQAVRERVNPIKFSALGSAFWNIDELKITESVASERRGKKEQATANFFSFAPWLNQRSFSKG